MSEQLYIQPVKKKSVWKIVVLVISILVLVFIGLITAIVFFVFNMIKNSEPYQTGLSTAEKSAVVEQYVGNPIKAGFFAMGSISIENSNGSADISIPITGPKGEGDIYVKAKKEFGIWKYQNIVFVPNGLKQVFELKD